MSQDEVIQQIVAEHQILKAVKSYMRAQDRLLPQLHLSAFHSDAWVDCGLFAGPADEFVKFAQDFLADCDATQHLIGQADIQVTGDSASGEIYFLAHHRITEDGQKKDLFVAGRYQDEYERRDGIWAITKRKEIVDWARTDPAADAFLAQQPALNIARRGPEG
ncbi:nuclear transport factor 2 family protein [Pseudomonas saliphila]|uniref:nuclear transport factor 2 family protein n=1 Tax=Pseudomonas saliphila TaxID=2586906 RepID=UPI00123AE3BD|nr:nuclear transport factor 2 family protein [Pseudomonas saliphila]